MAGPVVYAPDTPLKPQPPPPARGAVLFAPLSLFGLYFTAEVELAMPAGLAGFVAAGAGLFGQVGFEAGLRYYALGTALEGVYVDVRGAGFFLPGQAFGMLGPGVGLGYTWRTRSIVASIGAGATLWWAVLRTPMSQGLAGATLLESFAFPVTGFFEPPPGRHGVQPTVRLSFGPWF